jgi:hypothetical protein
MFPSQADLPVGEKVRGGSHAWVEWWAGDWHAWDPTNGRPVSVEFTRLA